MRNFVSPAIEESLMKVSPADSNYQQPEATYKCHGGWYGMETCFDSVNSQSPLKQSKTKKRIIKGARA